MLIMKMDELDPDAAKIVHVVCAMMLKCLAIEMEDAEAAEEPVAEVEAEAEAEEAEAEPERAPTSGRRRGGDR